MHCKKLKTIFSCPSHLMPPFGFLIALILLGFITTSAMAVDRAPIVKGLSTSDAVCVAQPTHHENKALWTTKKIRPYTYSVDTKDPAQKMTIFTHDALKLDKTYAADTPEVVHLKIPVLAVIQSYTYKTYKSGPRTTAVLLPDKTGPASFLMASSDQPTFHVEKVMASMLTNGLACAQCHRNDKVLA